MIIIAILALVGFVAGYFLSAEVLIGLTVVAVAVGVAFAVKAREIEKLVAVIYCAGAVIALVAMWVTHYQVTDQTWLGEFFQNQVLR